MEKPETSNLITLNNKNEVLLVKRTDSELWSLPGGTRKRGETSEECLEREIKEELGVMVRDTTFFQILEDKKCKASYYFGKINKNIVLEKKELSDYKWFKSEDLPQGLAYCQNKVLASFFADYKIQR